MKNIAEWIDSILNDLINPNKKLSDTLLKVQILASKINNLHLQQWVNNEQNGYKGKQIPDYRIINTEVFGDMVQSTYGGHAHRKQVRLPIEYLEKDLINYLKSIELETKVSELEKMIFDNGSYIINLPDVVRFKINKFTEPWVVISAWKEVSNSSFEGVLSTIKSTLLNFLLELHKEIEDNDNISIMKKQSEIDNIYNRTIGNIVSESINITIGDKSPQIINNGSGSNLNISTGDNAKQYIKTEVKNDIKNFIELLKKHIDELGFTNEEKEDIDIELQRIETQIKRENPKNNIIHAALTTINNILLGVATNAYTPIIIENLGKLI